jgi:KaiC/GvpD/RAD55 family RecA-like ATPase/predicted hydrocarbon binding protein
MDVVKSGIPELDKLLGGGLTRGKAYLVEATIGVKSRFIISAFCKQGYLDGDICRIDSPDDSYLEVIDNLKDGGFDATEATAKGKLLILDFAGDVIYGSKVTGPYLSKSSHVTDLSQFENLRYEAWEEMSKLKTKGSGIRVAVHGIQSLIRDFGLQSTMKFIVPQFEFLKREGAVIISTMNPDAVTATELAIIEESVDGIIELTIKEERMRYQRYIRVKSAPNWSFRQERVPYEIVGSGEGIAIGYEVAEEFEPFRANIRMPTPGVLDTLGSRSYIQDAEAFGDLHRLLFDALGYEKGYNLMYQVGFQSAKVIVKSYLEKFKIDISSPTTSTPNLIKKLLSYSTLRGYGRLELLGFDRESKTIRIRLTDSLMATHFAGFGKPVDAYIAGTIAAIAVLTLERNVVCRQTSCQAKGDDYCEFEVSPA